MSTIYSLVMMIVIVGLLREAAEAQFCSVTTFFLVFVAGIFIISAFLHPQVNNKMKIIKKEYHTVGTVSKSNKKYGRQSQYLYS